MSEATRAINVWYVSGLSLCNFDCAYCASGIPGRGGARTRDREWLTPDGAERYEAVLDWIARQPYRIGLRLQTIGEPFVSRAFLRGAARMARSANVRFVELVTNGSLITRRLPRLLGEPGLDARRVSLWITYHDTEIEAVDLVHQACYAREQGVSVVVNALLFPGNVDAVARLGRLCAEHGLRLNVDLGHNYNDSHPGRAFFPVLDDPPRISPAQLGVDAAAAVASLVAAYSPTGLECSAGFDYVHVTPEGDVFPCRGYRAGGERTRLGSALDPAFTLRLREHEYARCGLEGGCTCKEDFLHLRVARGASADLPGLGLGYPGDVPQQERALVARKLQPLASNPLLRALLAR